MRILGWTAGVAGVAASFALGWTLSGHAAREFCYVCMTNKIRGTTAGFTLRPIAIR